VNLTSTGRQNLIEFEGDIVRHPEVMECYTMTGIWDYMLKIVTRSIRHYEEFVRNTLTASPSIRELHSHMAVTEIKNISQLPLETQL
jgi:Lrp/AsnC family transcriptional regulator